MSTIVLIEKKLDFGTFEDFDFQTVCALPLRNFSLDKFFEIACTDLKNRVKNEVLDEALLFTFDIEKFCELMKFYDFIMKEKFIDENDKRKNFLMCQTEYVKVYYCFRYVELW